MNDYESKIMCFEQKIAEPRFQSSHFFSYYLLDFLPKFCNNIQPGSGILVLVLGGERCNQNIVMRGIFSYFNTGAGDCATLCHADPEYLSGEYRDTAHREKLLFKLLHRF